MSLRRLSKSDLTLVLSWRNALPVRMSMFSSQEIEESEHRAWFARTENDPGSRWYIHEDDCGNAMGVVYFTAFQQNIGSSHWGFYAAPSAPAGTGTRLGIDALDEAFGPLGLQELSGDVIATNERSAVFHRKLGFVEQGLYRRETMDGRGVIDVLTFVMQASDWPSNREAITRRLDNPSAASISQGQTE